MAFVERDVVDAESETAEMIRVLESQMRTLGGVVLELRRDLDHLKGKVKEAERGHGWSAESDSGCIDGGRKAD